MTNKQEIINFYCDSLSHLAMMLKINRAKGYQLTDYKIVEKQFSYGIQVDHYIQMKLQN